MLERSGKKAPTSILEEADRILEKERFGKTRTVEQWPAYRSAFGQPSHARYAYLSRALLRNWVEIRDRARGFPRSEFVDDITELRHEFNALRANMEALQRELASTRNRVQELSQEVLKLPSDKKTQTVAITEFWNAYIQKVKKLGVVREVLLSTSDDDHVPTIWTVIEGAPFEDSLRIPIYEAQFSILKSLKEDVLLGFHVINLSELSEDQSIEDIVPPDSDVLWQR